MSKILIEGNKVIIDGHANDLDTCNALTNLCDELSTSEKFRTIKYESGYGEFESVSENEEKKFAGSFTDFKVYSNDGSTLLGTIPSPINNTWCIYVDSDGLSYHPSTEADNKTRWYTYDGSKKFMGVSLTRGATSAEFIIGESYLICNDISWETTITFYIVEANPGYQVNIQSNDGTTTLAQNATVDSVVVTSTGAQLKCGDTVNATYTYAGSKLFAGLATSVNATAPKYKPGDTIEITAETTLYIVENIIIPEHHNSLNELFTNIAAVIREKTGDEGVIPAVEFPNMIRNKLEVIPALPYLTFSSPNSFTLKVNDTTKHWDGTLEYSTDASTWSTWDGTTTLSSATSGSDNVLYLRGTGNTKITGNNPNYKWVLTGSDIKCIGNIENLLDYATVESGAHPTMASYCYSNMFRDCAHLAKAPALPATTLADDCYHSMFYHCTSLTQAPALPATTLAPSCYYRMFDGCTGLTQAPALPATTLASNCYQHMFNGCTSLTQSPALPATTLADNCYHSMFYHCTSLTQAPALPATTLAPSCYYRMLSGCTSLTQAPALPATTLADDCYHSMFRDSTSLKLSSTQTGEYTVAYRIPITGTGTAATNALTTMFTSTGGTFAGTPEINTTYYLSNTNTVVG